MELQKKGMAFTGVVITLLLVVSFLMGGLSIGKEKHGDLSGIVIDAVTSDEFTDLMVDVLRDVVRELVEEFFYERAPVMTRTALALNQFTDAEEVRIWTQEVIEKKWTVQLGDMQWYQENPEAFKYLENRVGYSVVFEEYKSICMRM